MSLIAAIGEDARLAGYALAGVQVHGADEEEAARAAWMRLGDDVACLILTVDAHEALAPLLGERPQMIWAVVPE